MAVCGTTFVQKLGTNESAASMGNAWQERFDHRPALQDYQLVACQE
jgi:hypothetical protein